MDVVKFSRDASFDRDVEDARRCRKTVLPVFDVKKRDLVGRANFDIKVVSQLRTAGYVLGTLVDEQLPRYDGWIDIGCVVNLIFRISQPIAERTAQRTGDGDWARWVQ